MVAAADNSPGALAAAANVLEAAPDWTPGRGLAARACARAGLTAEAAALGQLTPRGPYCAAVSSS